jgi:hypothetical protein
MDGARVVGFQLAESAPCARGCAAPPERFDMIFGSLHTSPCFDTQP